MEGNHEQTLAAYLLNIYIYSRLGIFKKKKTMIIDHIYIIANNTKELKEFIILYE
jgi:hypothetical protein